MSSISASGTSLAQFFQSISQISPSQAGGSPTAVDPNSGDPQQSGVQGTSGGHHHHHGGGAQFAKIKDAVTSALQTAQANPSADPNKTIEDAIAKVLEGNINGSTTSTSGSATDDTDPTVSGSTDASGQTSASGTTSSQSFGQLLQSIGVSPQQFHQDFLAAVKDAQGGTIDPSTAFQNFPPGLNLDTTA